MRPSFAYRVCDLTLASNIAIPELQPTEAAPDCRFEIASPQEVPDEHEWFHEWGSEPDDPAERETWVHFGRTPEGILLRFPSCGDFLVSHDLSSIVCHPLPETPELTVRHLLLDQVIPVLLSRREDVVLHASAVLTPFGAVAFAGRSGQGKSTLAASFALHGHPLVSDDCLVLRQQGNSWIVVPSYPGVRLWPSTAEGLFLSDAPSADVAHYTSKIRIAEAKTLPFSNSPAPLIAFVFPSDDLEDIALESLSPSRSYISLIEFAYNLDIRDTNFLRRQMDFVSHLTEHLPSYALHYPRSFDSLPEVRQTILNLVEKLERS